MTTDICHELPPTTPHAIISHLTARIQRCYEQAMNVGYVSIQEETMMTYDMAEKGRRTYLVQASVSDVIYGSRESLTATTTLSYAVTVSNKTIFRLKTNAYLANKELGN